MLSQEGYAVVVVGDPNHPEVKSIISYIEEGVQVFTSLDEIGKAKGIRKAGVVAQTTQSFDNLMAFVAEAMKRFAEVRVFNTICNATTLRQEESTGLAGKADAMFVLGGYNSANTRRLAEICSAINPRTHHIETEEEVTRRDGRGGVRGGRDRRGVHPAVDHRRSRGAAERSLGGRRNRGILLPITSYGV